MADELKELEIQIARLKLKREELAFEKEEAGRARMDAVTGAVRAATTSVAHGAKLGESAVRSPAPIAASLTKNVIALIFAHAFVLAALVAINPVGMSGGAEFRAGAYFLCAFLISPLVYWLLAAGTNSLSSPNMLMNALLVLALVAGGFAWAGQYKNANYDRAVLRIKQAYPKLNPDHPKFSSLVSDIVFKRMQEYHAANWDKTKAMEAAVHDVCEPPIRDDLCR